MQVRLGSLIQVALCKLVKQSSFLESPNRNVANHPPIENFCCSSFRRVSLFFVSFHSMRIPDILSQTFSISCLVNENMLAGCHGQAVRMLGFGYRVCGFEYLLKRSVQFLLVFSSSCFLFLPTVCTLSFTMPVVTCSSVFDLSWRRQKERNHRKILAVLRI